MDPAPSGPAPTALPAPPPLEEGHEETPGSFAARFYDHASDPALLANLPVALIFCLFRWLGLIAAEPYWLYVVVVVGGGVAAVLAAMLWSSTGRRPDANVHCALTMLVIATVAYSTGWGPILSIGFLFGAAAGFQQFGSRAMRPALVWTTVAVGFGQLAVFAHVAPSLVRAPLVHGIAALGLVGALLVTGLLGRAAAERERIEAELRQSERRFRALVTHAADIIMVTDESGFLQYVSPAFEHILGYPADSYRGQSMGAFVHADDLRRMDREFPPLLEDPGIVLRTVVRGRDAQGRWRHFETTVTNRLHDPDVQGIVGNLHDITELRQADERFRSAFESAPIGMALTDLTGVVLRANPAMGRIVGRRPEALVGINVAELTHPDDRVATKAEMRRLVRAGSDGYRIEKRYLHSSGAEIWVSVSVSCVRDEQGTPLYLIGQVEDVTERRALREHLAYAAIHDSLTKLPNRELFMDRLTTALHRSARTGRETAVIFLDLDRFKVINDSLGHEAGDQVLEEVGARLSAVMRQSDTLARFGGDEFTVLCEDIHDTDDAVAVAERLVRALERPVAVPGGEVFVSFSAGVAVARPGEPGAATLRKADIAMYRAKERGRCHVELYREDDEDKVVSRLRTSNELHRALERDELLLHYQPVVDLHTETLVGMEALVRWQHPTRGLLYPNEFITLAEDGGLIVALGAWVLDAACDQAATWHRRRAEAGQDNARLNISVNVSAIQLADPAFTRHVVTALDRSGVDPDRLWLEITETTLMRDADEAAGVLYALRELGLHIEIDDFGTGYSSLSHLQRFPVETLKVDRSFVVDLDRKPENLAIVRAVAGLGDSLGLSVIAEGVERCGQVAELKGLGCFLAQGYLFGKPLPAAALGAFPADDLSSWRPQWAAVAS